MRTIQPGNRKKPEKVSREFITNWYARATVAKHMKASGYKIYQIAPFIGEKDRYTGYMIKVAKVFEEEDVFVYGLARCQRVASFCKDKNTAKATIEATADVPLKQLWQELNFRFGRRKRFTIRKGGFDLPEVHITIPIKRPEVPLPDEPKTTKIGQTIENNYSIVVLAHRNAVTIRITKLFD